MTKILVCLFALTAVHAANANETYQENEAYELQILEASYEEMEQSQADLYVEVANRKSRRRSGGSLLARIYAHARERGQDSCWVAYEHPACYWGGRPNYRLGWPY